MERARHDARRWACGAVVDALRGPSPVQKRARHDGRRWGRGAVVDALRGPGPA